MRRFSSTDSVPNTWRPSGTSDTPSRATASGALPTNDTPSRRIAPLCGLTPPAIAARVVVRVLSVANLRATIREEPLILATSGLS